MNILMITIGFRPNIGGIETHFDDFLKASGKRGYHTIVLTYQPIASKLKGKSIERGRNSIIYRLPCISGFFYAFVHKPLLEFLYLVPGLFFATPFLLLFKKIEVIHAHGLISGFVGVFWGKIFKKRIIVSTHSIYGFPQQGLYKNFAKFIFLSANVTLCLSQQSVREISSLGVPQKKIKQFTYWVDLEYFKPENKVKIKKELGWEKKFIVLFVGRLVSIKGLPELLQTAKNLDQSVSLVIIGDGPMKNDVLKSTEESKGKIIFLGRINNKDLAHYYNAADVLIVPSTHEEGFGRVILESLACGTPVIASKRGAIPDAMDETIGRFIIVKPDKIKKEIEQLKKNPDILETLKKNARTFAEKRYSEKNIEVILNSYYA